MSLKIENLQVALDGKPVLKNINLEIAKGEFFSLLGPSGCGKSTLLKTLAGLIEPQKGSICAEGRILDRVEPNKRGIVLLFQELRLFPNMTVEENIAFPLKMQKVRKKERLDAASELLKKVRLEGLERRRVDQLSGGQQQRIALARALAAKPQILLLDEPFSSIDENLRDDLRELLVQLHHETGLTMVLVTHDRREAVNLSERIAVMIDGMLRQCAKPADLLKQPADSLVEEYFRNVSGLDGIQGVE